MKMCWLIAPDSILVGGVLERRFSTWTSETGGEYYILSPCGQLVDGGDLIFDQGEGGGIIYPGGGGVDKFRVTLKKYRTSRKLTVEDIERLIRAVKDIPLKPWRDEDGKEWWLFAPRGRCLDGSHAMGDGSGGCVYPEREGLGPFHFPAEVLFRAELQS